MQLYNLTLRL
ncbi:uncharacterized protein CELE_Y39G8B.13 [Caenorhabditis elegans]|uniref:Uncharacterized protein n=1 Tax=Caenorhabditis elegans TaxID=6239 RepID=A0A2K5ATS2_CAEEL|nr:Uncharacterized protein CELE_Y39G8B.13 [Caenorhabditis elegans]SPC47307.2 Uncharacterized protein CELE_Y39G8B.13 [Caenorhabditis elegans]|eukprot:NP_001348720.2 Uncharacterized protein CELE_Y39G8B.13 [Caenorhabditis elegans]